MSWSKLQLTRDRDVYGMPRVEHEFEVVPLTEKTEKYTRIEEYKCYWSYDHLIIAFAATPVSPCRYHDPCRCDTVAVACSKSSVA